MPQTAQSAVADTQLLLPALLPLCARALKAAEAYAAQARASVERLVAPGGKLDANLLDREQRAAHGLSWLTTYVTALRQTLGWAQRLSDGGRLGEREALICQAAFAEYLAQMTGGLPMSQGEILRPSDLDMQAEA
ncbi:MAG TPA: acyl-CoA dehydrogenase, partial [Dongiaceae bacterium]